MFHHNLQSVVISKLLVILTVTLLMFVMLSLAKPVEDEDEADKIPSIHQIREKRSGISDQRLAELETLLALKRLRDQHLRTRTPVAYGLFDPASIGRRRKREHRFRYFNDDDGLMSDNNMRMIRKGTNRFSNFVHEK